MAVISGVVTGTGHLAANNKPDIEQVLRVLEPYQTPFTQWLMFIKKDAKEVKNKLGKFDHFERTFVPHQTQVSLAISESSGLTLTASNVDDVTFFNIGDIVLIEANDEMAYVSSGTIGTSVVLTHIDGSTSLSSIATGDIDSYIKVIGSANLEYTDTSGRKAMISKESNVYNYLNEFNKYVTTSGRDEAGEAWTDGMSHDELVEERIKELKLEVERYLMFSNSRGTVSSGNELRTYGYGLDGLVTTNVNTYTGDLSEAAFRSHLKEVYKKGTNKKIHFAGDEQMEDLEGFMNEKYELRQNATEQSMFKEYGLEAKAFRTFSGYTTLMHNPILDGKFTNYGYTVDEKQVRLRYMAPDKKGSRRFRIREIDLDRKEGTETKILMDVGLEVSNESTCGKLYKA